MGEKAEAERGRRREWVARRPGVRTVERPLADGRSFSLAYTRTGPDDEPPVLVFPGGPGLASVLPYQGVRALASKRGLNLLMVEHRGVGLSRTDLVGADLPKRAITIEDAIDDAVAVLDAEGIDRAIVYGTSYGSYLAQGFGVRHPDRVAGMVLDSTMLGAHFRQASEEILSDLFWYGTPDTRSQAATVRRLVGAGVIRQEEAAFPLQVLYEFGGIGLVDRMLALLQRRKGQRAWRWMQRLGASEVMTPKPFMMEFDLVGEIAFRELDYAATRGGVPLQTSGPFAEAAAEFSPFEAEPFDLPAEIGAFSWPTVIVSGDRDIRTPRAAAEEIAAIILGAILLPVRDHGHSTLDRLPVLALDVVRAVVDGIRATGTIDPAALPEDPHGSRGLLQRLISARLAFARFAPRPVS